MIIFKRIFLAFALFQLFISCAIADDSINKKDDTGAVNNKTLNGKCSDAIDKKTLKDDWYLWEPYQFNKLTASGYNLVGMDIELLKSIAQRVGISIENEPVNWKKHQEDLREQVLVILPLVRHTPIQELSTFIFRYHTVMKKIHYL